jgi:hypothetical protein
MSDVAVEAGSSVARAGDVVAGFDVLGDSTVVDEVSGGVCSSPADAPPHAAVTDAVARRIARRLRMARE